MRFFRFVACTPCKDQVDQRTRIRFLSVVISEGLNEKNCFVYAFKIPKPLELLVPKIKVGEIFYTLAGLILIISFKYQELPSTKKFLFLALFKIYANFIKCLHIKLFTTCGGMQFVSDSTINIHTNALTFLPA